METQTMGKKSMIFGKKSQVLDFFQKYIDDLKCKKMVIVTDTIANTMDFLPKRFNSKNKEYKYEVILANEDTSKEFSIFEKWKEDTLIVYWLSKKFLENIENICKLYQLNHNVLLCFDDKNDNNFYKENLTQRMMYQLCALGWDRIYLLN